MAGDSKHDFSHHFDVQIAPNFGYVLSLERAEELIREFETQTTSKFSCYKSRKSFGRTDLRDSKHRVHWEDKQFKGSLDFDGVPFMILDHKILDCQHGKDRHFQDKQKLQNTVNNSGFDFKKRRFRVQGTKKFDCGAQIKLREVVKFKDFSIPTDKDTHKRRSNGSEKLKNALSSNVDNSFRGERRIYIHLPSDCEHTTHTRGQGSGISQPVDNRIIAKIYSLVADGVNNVREMVRHIRQYVKRELFKGEQLPPATNRRFYPKLVDVRNHMYNATAKNRYSKFDQENVQDKIKIWQKENNTDMFHDGWLLSNLLPFARAQNLSADIHLNIIRCELHEVPTTKSLYSNMADKVLRLDLRGIHGETERGEKFWNVGEVEMKFQIEPQWIRAAINAERRPDYGMGAMNDGLEEATGNKLELVGPMMDGFLKEIALQINSKLTRSKSTGLATPVQIFYPWLLFRHLTVLIRGYGGSINTNKSRMTAVCSEMASVEKLFSPARFSGEDLIRKRHFKRQPNKEGKMSSVYKGRSSVVVSKGTPFTMDYNMKSQKLICTFYIQRYDSDDFVLDNTLQSLMNK